MKTPLSNDSFVIVVINRGLNYSESPEHGAINLSLFDS